MTRLHLDYETASEENLKTSGAYRYAEHPSTRPLMLGWAVDDEPVNLWQPHTAPMPPTLREAMLDPLVTKHAYNAQFERLITRNCLQIEIPPEQWRCTMVESYYLGFAGRMDNVLKAIGLEVKDARGGRLINMFCTPAPKNHKADWYNWENKPEEWHEFCQYCIQDVHVERQLWHWLQKFPVMHDWDQRQWNLDQRINDRGVPMDTTMASRAIEIWDMEKESLTQQLSDMTGLPRVTRGPFLQWIKDNTGVELESTRKDYLAVMLSKGDLPDEVKPYIDLWAQKEGKATSKYAAVLNGTGAGERARGMFQYKGASRTDRVGGRLIQLQNLKRPFVNPDEKSIGTLVDAIKCGSPRLLSLIYGPMSVSEILGGSIRHVIAAPPGKTFVICDLSSIESVVLGWVAQCGAIDETFRAGKDSYKEFGARYFGIAYHEVTKEQRSFSKPPVLGCFAAGTEVMTDKGWVDIVHVSASHKVFDGDGFVEHDGVIDQGVKSVITQHGVTATPDHMFMVGESEWVQFQELTGERVSQAIRTASGPFSPTIPTARIGVSVLGGSPVASAVRTYDIINAGPRSRFMVRTSEGPMIAHNCGFMLGWKGLIAYAEGYGVDMTQEQAKRAVETFRTMYPEIPKFWKWIYDAVKHVTITGTTITGYRMTIERDADFLRIWLPSGRALSYFQPEVQKRRAPWSEFTMTEKAAGATREQFIDLGWSDGEMVAQGYMEELQYLDNFCYMGMNDKNQWVRIFAHAGGITENIVQSIAGDHLWNGITNAENAGLPVVLHVHDEIAAEVDVTAAPAALQTLEACMTTPPAWAADMWLGASGFITTRYTKD